MSKQHVILCLFVCFVSCCILPPRSLVAASHRLVWPSLLQPDQERPQASFENKERKGKKRGRGEKGKREEESLREKNKTE